LEEKRAHRQKKGGKESWDLKNLCQKLLFAVENTGRREGGGTFLPRKSAYRKTWKKDLDAGLAQALPMRSAKKAGDRERGPFCALLRLEDGEKKRRSHHGGSHRLTYKIFQRGEKTECRASGEAASRQKDSVRRGKKNKEATDRIELTERPGEHWKIFTKGLREEGAT